MTADIHKTAKSIRTYDIDRTILDAVVEKLERTKAVKHCAEVRALCRESMRIRDAFTAANLRLVVSIARRFLYHGLPLADLIQEGNMGLMHAVPRFDYRRGLRFSTFATWSIRHGISRACADKSRGVRVPVHVLDSATKVRRHTARLTKELGRPPTPAELAKATGIPEKKLEMVAGPGYWLTGHSVPLDAPQGDSEGRSVLDDFVDPRSEEKTIADTLVDSEERKLLMDAISRLSPSQADLMRKRFGLDGDDGMTLKEVGELRGLSRERIRQLETEALKRLRVLIGVRHAPPAPSA